MTDNSTSIPTVGDDDIGSLEDHEVPPLSSTINPSPQHGGGFSIFKFSNLGWSCSRDVVQLAGVSEGAREARSPQAL